MDPLSVAVGAALVIAGAVIDRLMCRRTPGASGRVPSADCSCGHGYGTHEGGYRCHGEIQRDRFCPDGEWAGDWVGYDWVPCPCRLYDGPPPLPKLDDMWAIPQHLQLSAENQVRGHSAASASTDVDARSARRER